MSATCGSCGQKIPTPRRYTLGFSMVTGLVRLAKAGGGPITRKDLDLTGVEYSVFQKMTYWNLIEKGPGETWSLTPTGRAFLNDEAVVPLTVYALNGVRVNDDADFVSAAEVFRGMAGGPK